jgi:hypothetical protein
LINDLSNRWAALSDSDFESGAGLAAAKAAAAGSGVPVAATLRALRVLLTGDESGCSMGDALQLIGRKTALERLHMAIK